MSTIDGKITSADQTDILSDEYFELYTQTEDQLDAHNYLLGRVTMGMFASSEQGELTASTTMQPTTEDFFASQSGSTYLFGVDTTGKLRWKNNEIQLSNVAKPLHLVIVVTQQTPLEYLSYLQSKDISYVFAGERDIDFSLLLTKMKKIFGVEKLLLEGGGILNGSLMAQNCIDLISCLVTPTVVNQSDAPSLFENPTQSIDLKHFHLTSVEKLAKDVVWLQYTK